MMRPRASASPMLSARVRPMNFSKSKLIGGSRKAQASNPFLVALLLLVASAQVFQVVMARHVHPNYNGFRSALDQGAGADEDYDQQAGPVGLSRRQDFESDNDDDADDQNAAASYQNQDDGNGANGAADGYDDPEPDGPYEETPVEREGQADLERFFDDHLGASDRDGMDKENLPSNLVALLSEHPVTPENAPYRGVSSTLVVPGPQQVPQTSASGVNSIAVVPMASVVNPQVTRPIKSGAGVARLGRDPFQMMSTVQETSFIRLPDEKMIVTHQVTARNRPAAPLRLSAPQSDVGGDESDDEDEDEEDHEHRARVRAHSNQRPPLVVGHERRHAPASSGPQQAWQPQPQRQQHAQTRDALATGGSEVIATEDEDDDRVYATNATDRPFRIDALGGYDPEEDFIDAAKDLEVVGNGRDQASGEESRARIASASATGTSGRGRTPPSGPGEDDHYAWAASNGDRWHQAPGKPDISFHVPGTEQLYGDASETDEVTFGQDDPYQTDLEAEMRQQEYDKISGSGSSRRRGPAASADIDEFQPGPSGSPNEAVDNGQPPARLTNDDRDTDEEVDAEVDNDHRGEPKVEQTEARSTRAKSTNGPRGRGGDELDDEGSWVNDGVDEMDIPSQSHQNTVLEKAAQREEEEAARKAAEAQAAEPQPGQRSGQRAGGDEESQRMPNADYLRQHDLVDDDSAYAKAAAA